MKIKKRIIALNIGLVAVMLFSFLYIWANGGRYTLHTRFYSMVADERTAEVEVIDESVIRCAGVRRAADGETLIEFEAVGEGATRVSFSKWFGNVKTPPEYFDLSVNSLGTIIDTTMERFSFSGLNAVLIAIVTQLVMTLAVMLWMFVDYYRSSDYCYPMIACGGLSIYLAILLAYVVHYLLNEAIISFSFFLMLVSDTALLMLTLLTPIMLLLCVLLAVSNIWLMRHEGYRPVNALGILFAVLWFLGTLFTVGVYFIPYLWGNPAYKQMASALVYIVGYMECMFISTVVCSFLSTRSRPPLDRDYIIILGCAIRPDGSLTPLLKGRVDSALRFEREQYAATGKHAVFVPSGGQGDDETISEGEAMERYLLSEGVPADRISREDRSVNTYQNMEFSKKVIDAHSASPDPRIAFATTNYHIFRGYILSKKLGFEAKGISAATKLYFFPNAFLREFIGLLADQKFKHLIFIALTIGAYILLSLV